MFPLSVYFIPPTLQSLLPLLQLLLLASLLVIRVFDRQTPDIEEVADRCDDIVLDK